jgi:hypothetical protein
MVFSSWLQVAQAASSSTRARWRTYRLVAWHTWLTLEVSSSGPLPRDCSKTRVEWLYKVWIDLEEVVLDQVAFEVCLGQHPPLTHKTVVAGSKRLTPVLRLPSTPGDATNIRSSDL